MLPFQLGIYGVPHRRRILPSLGEITRESVVGHCSSCGCPIYGPRQVSSIQSVQVRHTCFCAVRNKTIQNLMLTK
jgi:hypothetical protein